MTRLLLVRHAQSQNNHSDELIFKQFAHDPEGAHREAAKAYVRDPGLSEIGRTQAERVAAFLVPPLSGGDFQDPLLISSPMRRALQTAMPMATAAGLSRARFVCHAELFEIGSGFYNDSALPSTRVEQLEAEYPVTCQAIPSDDIYVGISRESTDGARARVDRVIAWFEALLGSYQHDLVVVVAHGNLISRWLRRWIGVPWGRGLAFPHANASVTMLSWDAYDGLLINFVNNQSHLDFELRTGGGSSGWWEYTLPDIDIHRYDGWSQMPPELAAELATLRRHVLEPEGKSLADYAEADQRNVHFVARVEGVVAGYVQYDPEFVRLRQLVVAPSHRRNRLARRLVLEVEVGAHIDGHEQLLVHAWADAVEYYRELGFDPRGPVQPGPGRPWRAMVKDVST